MAAAPARVGGGAPEAEAFAAACAEAGRREPGGWAELRAVPRGSTCSCSRT